MAQKRPKKRIEQRPISSLKPHAMQAAVFGDLSDVELEILAEDIKQNNLRTPIEVLEDGTIICGHQRVRAYDLLRRKKITCWIRDDLEQQGAAAVEARLIEDNLHRRQLSKLSIARCYLKLKQAALENGYERDDPNEDLRDHLAKRFGLGGKQIERYVRMLNAPIVIQHAFDAGQLRQAEVLAVVKLDSDQQQEIVRKIEAGMNPKEVVKPYVQARHDNQVSVEAAVFRLVGALETAERQIAGRLEELIGRHLEPQLDKLPKGARFVQKLHKELKKRINEEASDDWLNDEQ